jgi:hypothetical protein
VRIRDPRLASPPCLARLSSRLSAGTWREFGLTPISPERTRHRVSRRSSLGEVDLLFFSALGWGSRHTVVYCDTMGRTQIYLGTEELELLDRVARVTGASRSELVRRAVRTTFGQPTKAEKLQALAASAGSWRGRAFTGSEYVDSVRGDLDARLGRLGLE